MRSHSCAALESYLSATCPIAETFFLKKRGLFVLTGQINDGVVSAGMIVRIRLDTSEVDTALTASIELVQRIKREDKPPPLALTVKIDDPAYVEFRRTWSWRVR